MVGALNGAVTNVLMEDNLQELHLSVQYIQKYSHRLKGTDGYVLFLIWLPLFKIYADLSFWRKGVHTFFQSQR